MYERLSRIDDINLGDHYHLNREDQCYFFGEYTARKGYSYSKTNQLIHNFKKGIEHRGKPQYAYKGRAIITIAENMNRLIPDLSDVTFIPIPPSKRRDDPLYDDRLIRVLSRLGQLNPDATFQDIIVQSQSTHASHESENRLSPAELEELYSIDGTVDPTNIRQHIIIFDDMVTAGSHYRAAKNVVERTFPGRSVYGVFVARRVPEELDVSRIFTEL
jgi:predicted amidophosphoribosyltransferase